MSTPTPWRASFRRLFSLPFVASRTHTHRRRTLRASMPMSTVTATAATVAAAYSISVSTPATHASPPLDDGPDSLTAHHVRKNGKTTHFANIHPSVGTNVITSPWSALTKMSKARWQGKMPTPDTSKAGDLPIVEPTFLPERTHQDQQTLRATWLGHACYFVEFPSGLRVLFDPVFEDRCGPGGHLGPKRYTPPPCKLTDLPHVDAVLISHSHYDHLSHDSVLQIQKKHPDAHFFVGLGLARWFQASGIKNVTEMDWWQDAQVTLGGKASSDKPDAKAAEIAATVSCLPCQHGSGRTLTDKDTTLWASWAVVSGGKSVWFGGDTGYRAVPDLPAGVDDYGPAYDALPRCPHFQRIGARFGGFDLGLIPIGAYSPRFMWSPVHANPYDAVEMFKDTRCRRAMGIHWGTWVLTSEAIDEPPKLLREALARSGIAETGVFDVCALGESREF